MPKWKRKRERKKTKSQITEGLIPFLKAVEEKQAERREDEKRKRGEVDEYVSPVSSGGLFFCVNSSTPFNF